MAKKRVIIIAVAAVMVAGFAAYSILHMHEESTDDASLEAHVISISPKVSGYIKAVHIDDNSFVKKGDVLFEIDPEDYIIHRNRAKAALDAAISGSQSLRQTFETTRISAPSSVEAAKAQVDAAEANWKKALADLHRMQHLSEEARSREQLDAAIATEKSQLSAYEDAKARLRSADTAPKVIAAAKSNSEEQAAQVRLAEADLAQAEKDLADTKIIAPEDGHIIKRAVEVGNYVQSGQELGYLTGTDIWVVADFKETQLTHMRVGDRATIAFDAYPSLKLEGKVDSIQSGTGARFSAFPPENATGNFVKIVQRVPVKIVLTHPADPAFVFGPGMSVVPTVYTQ